MFPDLIWVAELIREIEKCHPNLWFQKGLGVKWIILAIHETDEQRCPSIYGLKSRQRSYALSPEALAIINGILVNNRKYQCTLHPLRYFSPRPIVEMPRISVSWGKTLNYNFDGVAGQLKVFESAWPQDFNILPEVVRTTRGCSRQRSAIRKKHTWSTLIKKHCSTKLLNSSEWCRAMPS